MKKQKTRIGSIMYPSKGVKKEVILEETKEEKTSYTEEEFLAWIGEHIRLSKEEVQKWLLTN